MLKTTQLVCVSLLVIALNSCSSFNLLKKISNVSVSPKESRLCATDEGDFYECKDMLVKNKTVTTHPSLFSTKLLFNQLNEYTEQMAADLQNDVRGMQIDQPIVVASFVNLDSSLQNTNTLGIQLAELFMNDLQQIGLPVSDHKLMGVLDINAKGDFAFSRNMEQFYNQPDIGYVLSGTMQRNSKGVVVNARIMNFTTNKIIASSSKFLPNVLLEGML